ncbi:hypothetical protein BDW02DRAFT_610118 [Decorospora gaudefroyi]|uniref:Uncharacterized protein n=1 Tax=Decorospora gaudefroyi TaxID=184978 RepID=A0A6A5JZV2_9PLEO|nr:hypothetical protein BDW02DRAFT_610118 [Decorospora gaudefroyi]
MPPKKSNPDPEKNQQNDSKSEKPVSDEEVRQESGKAADAALAAQKKAKELKDAAAAAGDPEERQKLTEQATNAQIEAESFGKTAKYLRSGAFQGMAMGTGLGVAPGATLGAITGTLVGGISSTLLGGLGAGLGGATGAIHGPFWNMGKVAGKGMKKLTGFLPEWAASEEQKRALEKMVGQANEEDMPGTEELEKFKSEGGGGKVDQCWMDSAKGMMPDQKEVGEAARTGAQATGGGADSRSSESTSDKPSGGDTNQKSDGQGRKKPRKLNAKSSHTEAPTADDKQAMGSASTDKQSDAQTRDRDLDERVKKLDQREAELERKQAELDEREKALAQREQELESKSDNNTSESTKESKPRGKPRKLEPQSSEA